MEGGDAGGNVGRVGGSAVGSGGDGGGAGGGGDGESSSEGESEEVLDVSFISPSSVSGEDGSPNNMFIFSGPSSGADGPKPAVHFLATGGVIGYCLLPASSVGTHVLGAVVLGSDSHPSPLFCMMRCSRIQSSTMPLPARSMSRSHALTYGGAARGA